jgi:anti-sigma-K factor RskA
MIDERQEEFASLYALELLEGRERAEFEANLAADSELQALVRSFRETSAALVHTAPTLRPPADLKVRVMGSVASRPAGPAPANNVVRPPLALFRRALPWAAAACFAFATAWLGQNYLAARAEAETLQSEIRLAEIALKSTQQQLEAERIVTLRQRQDVERQLAAATTEAEGYRTRLNERELLLAEAKSQLAERERLLSDRDRLLADTRAQVADRELQAVTLRRRLDDLAGTSSDVSRQLSEAMQRLTLLNAQLRSQGDIARFKITTLASMLKNSPQAVAVAVWDPAKQEGVLKVDKLPPLKANQDYQLWVVDPQYPNPVDGGVFTVEPGTGNARMAIKAKQPVGAVSAFAVTLERKGGVPKAEGPFVLLGK